MFNDYRKRFEDLMSCCGCGVVRPFDQEGHQDDYNCNCGGQWCGCDYCCSFHIEAERF